VSFDTVEENSAFAEKFDFPFLLLADRDRAIGLAYGAAQAPSDAYANRISYLIGPDGKIEHVWGKVDVKQHPQEALDAIG
jgi:peroxiredoxin Q/BCP